MKNNEERFEAQTRTQRDGASVDESGNARDFDVADTPSTEPSSLGRFEVLRALAEGGLGKVSIARDAELNREVALKQIKPQYCDDPRAQMRFLREAEVTGSLEHPGIVPVYGLGVDDEQHPYYAMRLIRGESMSNAISRLHRSVPNGTELDRGELLKLLRRFVDVCNTMDYAHSHKIIHRDLKPGNIMLGPYGETLVVDWGLAKRLGPREFNELVKSSDHFATDPTVEFEAASTKAQVNARVDLSPETKAEAIDSNVTVPTTPANEAAGQDVQKLALTMQGTIIGTLSYMSPEQAAGEVKSLTSATDIYSLGAILYTILTGQSPLAGVKKALALPTVLEGTYSLPRQRLKLIPRPLESICMRAMKVAAAQRYASAKDLADEIESWMADQPVKAHREAVSERATRLVRRHRSWAVAIFAASCLLAVGSIISLVMINSARNRADQQSRAATSLRLAREAETLRTSAPVRSSLLALESLKVTSKDDGILPQARAAVYNALPSIGGQQIVQLASFPRRIAKRADGNWLTVNGQFDVQCWDFADARAQDREPFWTIEKDNDDESALDSTGRFFAVGKVDGTLELWNLTNSPPTKQSQQVSDSFIDFLAFDAQGKWLVTTSQSKAVLWDLRKADGNLVRRGEMEITTPIARTWFARLPTQRLLIVGNRMQADTFSTMTEVPSPIESPFEQPLRILGTDPHRKWLATHPYSDTIRLWDVSVEPPVMREYAIRENFYPDSIEFSADGRRAVVGSRSGDCFAIDTASPETGVQNLQPHADRITSLAFNASSNRCATASRDGLVRIWEFSEIGQPTLMHELRGHDGMISALTFDGDDILFSGGFDGTIRKWSMSGELTSAAHRRSYFGSYGWEIEFLDNGQLFVSGGEPYVQLKDIASQRTATDLAAGATATANANASDMTTAQFDIEGYRCGTASRDGRWLVVSDSVNYRSYDLRARNPEPVATWKGAQFEYAIGMDFSPDGKYLVSAGLETLLWKFENGNVVGPPQKIGDQGQHARFSHDGKWLAVSPPESLDLYRFANGQATRVMTMPGQVDLVEAVDFSHDGKELAWAGRDGVIHIYDLTTASGPVTVREYRGHFQGVTSLRYSPDGKWFATSGSRDATVCLWDRSIDDSRPADTHIRSGNSQVLSVDFSRDSKWLAASYEDGYIRAWNLDLQVVADELRERIGRELTADERREFLLPQIE